MQSYSVSKELKVLVREGSYKVGPDMTKPVLGVSDKATLKPVSSATETS